jgi:hypothetical protein
MLKPIKVIFFDIDGVLNGYSQLNNWMKKFLHSIQKDDLYPKFRRKTNGIDEKRVKLLLKIVKKTGAVCVLTSKNRDEWNKRVNQISPEMMQLKLLIAKYRIHVIDVIGHDPSHRKELEIFNWLVENQNYYSILSFCVLDVDWIHMPLYWNKELVHTSQYYNPHVDDVTDYVDSGLNKSHVDRAIQVLNGQESELCSSNKAMDEAMTYYEEKYMTGELSMWKLLEQEVDLPLNRNQIKELLRYAGEHISPWKIILHRHFNKGLVVFGIW